MIYLLVLRMMTFLCISGLITNNKLVAKVLYTHGMKVMITICFLTPLLESNC